MSSPNCKNFRTQFRCDCKVHLLRRKFLLSDAIGNRKIQDKIGYSLVKSATYSPACHWYLSILSNKIIWYHVNGG